jgi:hypothetical protein
MAKVRPLTAADEVVSRSPRLRPLAPTDLETAPQAPVPEAPANPFSGFKALPDVPEPLKPRTRDDLIEDMNTGAELNRRTAEYEAKHGYAGPLRDATLGDVSQAALEGIFADLPGSVADISAFGVNTATGAAEAATLGARDIGVWSGLLPEEIQAPKFATHITDPMFGSQHLKRAWANLGDLVGIEERSKYDLTEGGKNIWNIAEMIGSALPISRAATGVRTLERMTPHEIALAEAGLAKPLPKLSATEFAQDMGAATGAGLGISAAEQDPDTNPFHVLAMSLAGAHGGGAIVPLLTKPVELGRSILRSITPEVGMPQPSRQLLEVAGPTRRSELLKDTPTQATVDEASQILQQSAVNPQAAARRLDERAAQARTLGDVLPDSFSVSGDEGLISVGSGMRSGGDTGPGTSSSAVFAALDRRLADANRADIESLRVPGADQRLPQRLAEDEKTTRTAAAVARQNEAERAASAAEQQAVDAGTVLASRAGRGGDASAEADRIITETLRKDQQKRSQLYDLGEEGALEAADATPLQDAWDTLAARYAQSVPSVRESIIPPNVQKDLASIFGMTDQQMAEPPLVRPAKPEAPPAGGFADNILGDDGIGNDQLEAILKKIGVPPGKVKSVLEARSSGQGDMASSILGPELKTRGIKDAATLRQALKGERIGGDVVPFPSNPKNTLDDADKASATRWAEKATFLELEKFIETMEKKLQGPGLNPEYEAFNRFRIAEAKRVLAAEKKPQNVVPIEPRRAEQLDDELRGVLRTPENMDATSGERALRHLGERFKEQAERSPALKTAIEDAVEIMERDALDSDVLENIRKSLKDPEDTRVFDSLSEVWLTETDDAVATANAAMKKFYDGATDTPFADRIVEGAPVATIRQLQDARGTMSAAQQAARTGDNPDFRTVDALRDLKGGVDRTIDEFIAGNPKSKAAKQLKAAKDFDKSEFNVWLHGEGDQFRRRFNQSPESRDKSPPTATLGYFIREGTKGASEAASDLAAISKRVKDPAKLRESIRSYFMASAAQTVDVGGIINEKALRAWRTKYADALKQFPELNKEFLDLANSSGTMTRNIEKTAGELRAARDAFKATEKEIKQMALAPFLDAEPKQAVASILNGKDPEVQMRTVLQRLGKNQAARDGMKDAISEHLYDIVTGSNAAAGTEGVAVSASKMLNTVERYNKVFRQVYTPDEMGTLERLQRTLRDMQATSVRAGTGSTTVDRLASLKNNVEMLFKLREGHLAGASSFRSFKMLLNTIPGINNQDKISRVLLMAAFDPQLASMMLKRPPPPEKLTMFANQVTNRLAALQGIQESVDDDEKQMLELDERRRAQAEKD